VGRILCLYCALGEARRQDLRADGVYDGTSLCAGHAEAVPATPSLGPYDGAACAQCAEAGRRHAAWFALDDVPLCVRHAADEVYPRDDMAAHQVAHDLYLRLHAEGEQDRY